LQVGPRSLEFLVVNLRPRLNQTLLRLRKLTGNTLDPIYRERRLRICVHCVEMRSMMGRAGLGKHPNDDAEETGQFGHVLPYIVASSRGLSG